MYFPPGSILSMNLIDSSYLFFVSMRSFYSTKLLHCENNASTQYQPPQSWQSTRPKGQQAFFSKYPRGTSEAVPVLFLRLYRLHPCFDRIQRHCYVARDCSQPECAHCVEPLSRGGVTLSHLFQRRVASKPCCGVGRLPCCCRHQSLEKSPDALLTSDYI
jgi:hypothetical protein